MAFSQSRRVRLGAAFGALVFFSFACFCVGAGEPPPKPRENLSFYGLETGRFEVAALAGPEGARLGELAEQAWTAWRGPLGLPERWPVGITVRLSPAAGWPAGAPPWRVAAEPGGIVSVWVRQSPAGTEAWLEARLQLEALAAGAMQRQAIFIGVSPERVTIPAWLRAAAAEAVLVRQQPSLSDAWLREAAALTRAPGLKSVLDWKPVGSEVSGGTRLAAYGVWVWLQAEGTRSGAWRRFLAELLAGGDAAAALARNFGNIPGRGSEQELELAWQTAFAQIARVKNVPVLEPKESRRWLEQIDRFVLLEAAGGEQVLPLGELWSRRKLASVREQLEARSTLLAANLRTMHPFYRNAAVSWGRACVAILEGKESVWKSAEDEWRQDMETGLLLEAASKRILDEAGGGAAR